MKETSYLHASMKQEVSFLHKQAALKFSGKSFNPIRSHRRQKQLKRIGAIAKNGGLGLAALGGIVTLLNTISTDKKTLEITITTTIHLTTLLYIQNLALS